MTSCFLPSSDFLFYLSICLLLGTPPTITHSLSLLHLPPPLATNSSIHQDRDGSFLLCCLPGRMCSVYLKDGCMDHAVGSLKMEEALLKGSELPITGRMSTQWACCGGL